MVSGQEEEKATHPVHVAKEEGYEAEPHDDVTPGDAAPPCEGGCILLLIGAAIHMHTTGAVGGAHQLG